MAIFMGITTPDVMHSGVANLTNKQLRKALDDNRVLVALFKVKGVRGCIGIEFDTECTNQIDGVYRYGRTKECHEFTVDAQFSGKKFQRFLHRKLSAVKS